MGTTNVTYETLAKQLSQTDKPRRDSYSRSAPYYMLTGRKGLWVYEGYGALLVVCRHPNQKDCLLVFPEIGRATGQLTVTVLEDLKKHNKNVQLARTTQEDIAKVRALLSARKNTTLDSVTAAEENLLDWLYPVHILDTQNVANMNGKKFYNIRKEFNKVSGKVENIPLTHPKALRAMRAVLKFWEGGMIAAEKDEIGDISGYYETLFAMIETWPTQFDGHVFIQNGRPVGFSIWDRTQGKTANFLANLCDHSIKGLSEYQVVKSCETLAKEGIERLNFGGSETKGLNFFKEKFNPVESFNIHSAKVAYKAEQQNITRADVAKDFFKKLRQSQRQP